MEAVSGCAPTPEPSEDSLDDPSSDSPVEGPDPADLARFNESELRKANRKRQDHCAPALTTDTALAAEAQILAEQIYNDHDGIFNPSDHTPHASYGRCVVTDIGN